MNKEKEQDFWIGGGGWKEKLGKRLKSNGQLEQGLASCSFYFA